MSWEEDYARLTGSCAHLSLDWGKLRFTGPDAKKFLNGLVTNDVARLKAGSGLAACLLTPKGMLRAHFLLYDVGDGLLALCPGESAGNLLETMRKMVALSESKLEDLTEALELVLLAGPRTDEVLAEALGARSPGAFGAGRGRLGGSRVDVLSWPRLSPEACLLVAPASASAALRAALAEAGAPAAASEALEAWRIEKALPRYGTDMGDDTIPLEAGLEDAVSFDKGCYMGQETISRVRHLGRLNRRLVRLKVSAAEPPAPGSAVLDAGGRPIGKLTSAAVCPARGAILALAMVRLDSAKPGAILGVASRRGSHKAEVLP